MGLPYLANSRVCLGVRCSLSCLTFKTLPARIDHALPLFLATLPTAKRRRCSSLTQPLDGTGVVDAAMVHLSQLRPTPGLNGDTAPPHVNDPERTLLHFILRHHL